MASRSLDGYNKRILLSMLGIIDGDPSKLVFEDEKGNGYTISDPELYKGIVTIDLDLEKGLFHVNDIAINFHPYKFVQEFVGLKSLIGKITIRYKNISKKTDIISGTCVILRDDALYFSHNHIGVNDDEFKYVNALCMKYNEKTNKNERNHDGWREESVSSEEIFSEIHDDMASNNYSEEDIEKVISIVSPVIEDMIRKYNSLHYFKDSKKLKPVTRTRKR